MFGIAHMTAGWTRRTARSNARLARWLDAQVSPFARATHRRQRLRAMSAARDGAARQRTERDSNARRRRDD
jgi:hypothetical protein